MIGYVARGVAQFLEHPQTAMQDMRAATPAFSTALTALVAATLVMVVIDLAYGPLAFPHTLLPGGKRSLPTFSIAAIELTRALGYASVVLLGVRLLRGTVTIAEAVWMTVAYAVALVLFEALQMASWLLFVATGLNLYGPAFLVGFGATILVLVAAIRALVPERDWLTCLLVAISAFVLGQFVPYLLIPLAVSIVALDWLQRARRNR